MMIKKVYTTTIKAFKSHPGLFLPFLIFAAAEAAMLLFLHLGWREPLRQLFAPPIKRLYGEQFLHYPFNFLLLPKLSIFSRLGLSILLGAFLSGAAVVMTGHVYQKQRFKLAEGFRAALKKYVSLCLVVAIFTFIYYLAIKLIMLGMTRYFISGHTRFLFLEPKMWLGPLLLAINFFLAVMVQSAFIYTIPLMLLGEKKLAQSITGSLALFKRLFFPTLILVVLPMIVHLPLMLLNYNMAFLITKVSPEFVLLVSFLNIVVLSLFVDPLTTISTAFLYLTHKEQVKSKTT